MCGHTSRRPSVRLVSGKKINISLISVKESSPCTWQAVTAGVRECLTVPSHLSKTTQKGIEESMETHLLGQEAWPPALLTSSSTCLPGLSFPRKSYTTTAESSPEATENAQSSCSSRTTNHVLGTITTVEPETAGEGSTSPSAIPPTSGWESPRSQERDSPPCLQAQT